MANSRSRSGKFPTIKEIARLCAQIKTQIEPEFRVSDDSDDDEPGILLTVGADGKGGWGWQTGDTQYHGGAYGYPHWGSAGIHGDTKATEAAKSILDEIRDSYAMSR